MCGIFALLNNNANNSNFLSEKFIEEQFKKGRHRGPEFSTYKNVMIKAEFGFHRLAINGLNSESNQPIIIDDVALICNGEIYNYKELYEEMMVTPLTNSDCEIIIHLYLMYGIEHTLQVLDGVFSFALIDYRLSVPDSKMYIARDPYGVRPLYFLHPDINDRNKHRIFDATMKNIDNEEHVYAFASELKMLTEIKDKLNEDVNFNRSMISGNRRQCYLHPHYIIDQFKPGTYSELELKFKVSSKWTLTKQNVIYHTTGFQSNINHGVTEESVLKNIQCYLKSAVEKRCSTSDRPIACLLSGGLDSSLIAALVNDYHVRNGLPAIETYSIGLSGSEDLKYANIVAEHLGTNHTPITVSEDDFLNAIPYVINNIESYDTTSVRASIGNWLLGKYISENSQAKVIFNGDGSDELTGGYLYFNYIKDDPIEFDRECRRLLKDIYMFDVLRSDKCISSHGLEPRTPFLDRSWVQYYLTIPTSMRYHVKSKNMEKYLLRKAFSGDHYLSSRGTSLLPEEVLMRRKEAFSDGVSKNSRSLYQIIQEYTDKLFKDDDHAQYSYLEMSPDIYSEISVLHPDMCELKSHLLPNTSEQFYYRKTFESFYPGMGKIVPYFWMPRYTTATDASARTLDIYNTMDEE